MLHASLFSISNWFRYTNISLKNRTCNNENNHFSMFLGMGFFDAGALDVARPVLKYYFRHGMYPKPYLLGTYSIFDFKDEHGGVALMIDTSNIVAYDVEKTNEISSKKFYLCSWDEKKNEFSRGIEIRGHIPPQNIYGAHNVITNKMILNKNYKGKYSDFCIYENSHKEYVAQNLYVLN